MSEAKPKKIGGDWVESVDVRTGRTYYANMRTKQTTWTFPEELREHHAGEDGASASAAPAAVSKAATAAAAAAPAATAAAAAAAAAAAIDDDWRERVDPTTGRPYYYNKRTRVSTWTRPACMALSRAAAPDAAAPAAASASAPLPAATATTTTSTATIATTAASASASASVAAAAAAAAPAAAASASTTPAATAASDASADDWVATIDQASGRTYYYNRRTRATSWKKPTAAAPCSSAASAASASTSATSVVASIATALGEAEATAALATTAAATESTRAFSAVAPPVPSAAEAVAVVAAEATSAIALPPALQAAAAAVLSGTVTLVTAGSSEEVHSAAAGTEGGAEEDEEKLEAADEDSERFRKLKEVAQSVKGLTGAGEEGEGEVDDDGQLCFLPVPYSRLFDCEPPAFKPMDMLSLAETRYNLSRKGMFKTKTSVNKITSFKPVAIKMPLLADLSRELAATALQCYKWVMEAMGDRSRSREWGVMELKLVKTLAQAPPQLCDEVYCQLCKQLTNNPNPSSVQRGWRLMALLTSCFPCSSELLPYLGSFIDERRIDMELGSLATAALRWLVRCMSRGEEHAQRIRRDAPTLMEVAAVMAESAVLLRVHFTDGRFVGVAVEPWMTFKDLRLVVQHKVGAKVGAAFGVFETSAAGELNPMVDSDLVMDQVSFWQRVHREEAGKSASAVAGSFYFLYRPMYYFDVADEDRAAVRLMFMQAVMDVLREHYPVSEEDATVLAALLMQHRWGNYTTDLAALEVLSDALEEYVPSSVVSDNRVQLRNAIVKQYQKYTDYSRYDCELAFMDLIKGWDWYGAHYFGVEWLQPDGSEMDIVLAITPRFVLLITDDTREIMQKLLYSEIPSWGFRDDEFHLHQGSAAHQTRLLFRTDEGREMNALVQAYVDHIIHKRRG